MNTVRAKDTRTDRNNQGNVLFLRGVPPELRNEFKTACVRNGSSMIQEVLKFMQDYVLDMREQQEKAKPTKKKRKTGARSGTQKRGR